jgi:HPt (histidine-containing phosphotransfer) domain-containing protein
MDVKPNTKSSFSVSPNLWSLAPEEILADFPMTSEAMSLVVRLFRESAVENLSKIRQALEVHDDSKFFTSTHALKGSLGMFASRLTLELLSEVETKVKEGGLESARELFENLAQAIESLEPTLKRLDQHPDVAT